MILTCDEWKDKFGIHWSKAFIIFKDKTTREHRSLPLKAAKNLMHYISDINNEYTIYYAYTYKGEDARTDAYVVNMWHLHMTEKEIKKYLAFL